MNTNNTQHHSSPSQMRNIIPFLRRFKVVFVLISSLILFSCSGDPSGNNSSDKTQVICTTGVIADAMSNILPPAFEVKSLMGPGVDPHTYKSKTSEMKELMKADAIVYNGIHFEANLIDAIENIAQSSFVVSLGDIVPKERLRATADFGSAFDPHLWHDVNLFATSIQLAGNEFATKFPTYKSYIDSATKDYTNSLFELENFIHQEIAKIPDSSRVLVTAHDAFGYYGRLFKIEVKGVQGISTSSDISLRGITELTDLIVSRRIPAIFVENSVSEKNIQSIMEGCKEKGLELKNGGTLFSDGLGDAKSGAETYIKMIKKNTQTIVSALTQND